MHSLGVQERDGFAVSSLLRCSLLNELELISLICYFLSVGAWVGHCDVRVDHGGVVDVWVLRLRELWSVGWGRTSIDVAIEELKVKRT